MSIEKHIVINHLQNEIDFLKSTKKPLENNLLAKKLHSNNGTIVIPLGPTIVTKEETQRYYETLCQTWFESKSKLWNFTINPDPKKTSGPQCETFGKLKDSLIRKRISDHVKLFFNRKKLHDVVEEAVLYWEYGDKTGKFHCNCTIKVNPKTDDKVRFVIEHEFQDTYGSNRAIYFKDGRKFNSADIYNCKDAGFMAKMGSKPLYLTRKNL